MKLISDAFNLSSLFKPYVGVAAGVSGALGVYINKVYGLGNSWWILILVSVIILDWITAIAAAQKDKTYASQYGINGLLRTVFILALPAVANLFDIAFETRGFIFLALTGGLVYHTWQSMTANAFRAGWEKWIPKKVLEHVGSEIEAKTQRSNNRKSIK